MRRMRKICWRLKLLSEIPQIRTLFRVFFFGTNCNRLQFGGILVGTVEKKKKGRGMMKRLLAILLTAVMTFSLAACGQTTEGETASGAQTTETKAAGDDAEEETVEITFWHSYSEGEEAIFTEQVLTAFEEAYPNIRVNAIRMPYESLDEELVTAVSGDAAPDVIRLDLTWVSQMAKLGALECLDGYEGFDEIAQGIVEGSLSTTLYKGEHYGLPLNANTTVAVYNNAVLEEYGFEEAPETMEELMEALNKTDPEEEKWLFCISGSYNWAMLPFIWTLGGSVTDEDYTQATGYLNSEATVEALDTIVAWYQDGVIGPAIMGEQPDSWGGIEAGNYAMMVEGPWFFSASDVMDTYTPALLPSVDGRSISIVGGEDIAITSTSGKKDAAWTFIRFMMEDEQQIAMAAAGMIPVSESAMSQVDTTDSPYVSVYMEQLKTAQARIPCASWPTIETILNTAFESVLRGSQTSQEALDDAAAQIDALLMEE